MKWKIFFIYLYFITQVHSVLAGNLSARLLIAGPLDLVHTYWGHVGLAIDDEETGQSMLYDFGHFSFEADDFYRDFLLGRMWYLGLESTTEYFTSNYLPDSQYLFYYPLNLGNEKIKEMQILLKERVSPENSRYLYNYFTNNCSTIIRDVMDEVLDGQIKAQTYPIKDRSFRYYTRTGVRPSLSLDIILSFLLGSNTDKTITGWDKMFLPIAIEEFVADMEYIDEYGVHRKVLGEKVILKETQKPSSPENPRLLWPGMLITGIILALLWLFIPDRIIGRVIRTLIVLIIGIPGIVLCFVILFTDHDSAYRNLNVGPSLPTVLLSLIPLFASGWKHRDSIIMGIWSINLAGLILVIILHLSGIINQEAGAFWAFYAPICLAATCSGFLKKLCLR